MDHNAVMESMDSDFHEPAMKYVDDMTSVEHIPTSAPVVSIDTTGEQPTQVFHAEKIEENVKNAKKGG